MLRVSHHLPLRRFICKPNVQRSHDFAVVFGNGNKMPQNVTYALCSVDVGQTIEGPGCVALILDKHSLKDSCLEWRHYEVKHNVFWYACAAYRASFKRIKGLIVEQRDKNAELDASTRQFSR